MIEVFDNSAVNFMVGSTLLILWINYCNLLSPCPHKKNMSSINLHHIYGLYSDSFIISSSSSTINKMLCAGANYVPIAVPHFCLSVFYQNLNILFLITTSAKSIIVSVETYFSFQVSSLFLNADRPFSYGMFGYNPTTSIVYKIMPSGNFGREWSFSRNSLMPLKVTPTTKR